MQVCLQEVDAGAFARWWEPRLRHAGYSGRFTPKLGGVAEGQAVFVRDARYAFRDVRPVAVRELFADAEALERSGLAAVGGLLAELPNLRAALQRLATEGYPVVGCRRDRLSARREGSRRSRDGNGDRDNGVWTGQARPRPVPAVCSRASAQGGEPRKVMMNDQNC